MSYKELYNNTKFRWLMATLLVVAPFSALSFFSIHFSVWFELPLFLTIIIVFGRKVFISGVKSLFKLNFSNINLLMTVATIGALYLKQFEEAVIIILLFALGDTLEGFGIKKSKAALKELIDKAPKSAEIKGKEDTVPIEEIMLEEIIIVRPGDHIPMDGEVMFGSSLVDEASITGEPIPKDKHVGDPVYAGTVNGTGYMEVKVTKLVKDMTLSKIVELTYKSAQKKSVSQKFIEKFAKFYTPMVMLTSISLVVIPVVFLGKPFDTWFVQALTLLIISCPCALVISTPVAIFSAIGNATQKGVIIKGGRFLEEMGKIKAIAFDKTRTLTRGEPAVSDIIPLNGFTEEEVIACAAGMEAFSEHPIAKSILNKAKEKGVDIHEFTNFQAVPGKGLKGECTVCFDSHHCMGNLKFVSEEHDVSEEVIARIGEFEKEGKTTIVISDNNKVKGLISVTDEIREESKPLIENLIKLKVEPVILTGDNFSSAGFVAAELGINTIRASLLPDKKVEELTKLIEQYKHVAMVGDGVNDAPALATASVGIAMGAIGSDVAIENADIALMHDNLDMIPYLIELGKKCVGKIKFNIASAVLVKFLFLALAIGGISNLALAIFADVGVTVLVILNSLRLYNFDQA